jgi:hypothetical protein
VLRSGTAVSLDPGVITADVSEFRAALASGDQARAVSYVRGPFLEGFYLPGATLFERWVEGERARLQAATTQALTTLATQARATGDHESAIEWWRQLTVLHPLSGRFALGFLKALAAGGHRAEALAFARAHEAVVRRELEADPDPDIRALEAALRSMPGKPAGDPSTLPLAAPAPAPVDAAAARGVAPDAHAEQAPVLGTRLRHTPQAADCDVAGVGQEESARGPHQAPGGNGTRSPSAAGGSSPNRVGAGGVFLRPRTRMASTLPLRSVPVPNTAPATFAVALGSSIRGRRIPLAPSSAAFFLIASSISDWPVYSPDPDASMIATRTKSSVSSSD